MTELNGNALASRRSPAKPVGGAAEDGIASVFHVKNVASLSHILGRKWTTTIVIALAVAPIRHGPLCRKLSGISRKVLHESLNSLIDDGLVEKVIGLDDLDGVSVSYGLTTLGYSLSPVLTQMDLWCSAHLEQFSNSGRETGPQLRVKRTADQGDHR